MSFILNSGTTKLAKPVDIGGVPFDGSADIDLPGVNIPGNQDTTGSAARLTSIENNNIVQLDSNQILSNKTLESPILNGDITGDAILDEDDFRSNSETKLATQRSIKTYVDLVVPGAGEIVAGTGMIRSDNILNVVGGTGIRANVDDISIDNTVVQLDNVQTLSNKTLISPNITGTGNITSNTINTATLQIGGTSITAIAAELNILDGVTASTDELNIMDGVTASTAELNIMDGVTASTDELNIMDGMTASTAELNIMDGVTASTAELNIMDGVTASTAELNIMDGVTASTAELNIMDGVTASTAELNIMDGMTASTDELNIMNGVTASTAELNIMDGVTASTDELNIMDGVTASTDELNIMDGVTASTDELNIMDGVTASTAELNHVNGVTSNIQNQIDSKLAIEGAQAALSVDDIINLTGVDEGFDNLGNFTGTTIGNSRTIKAALQDLETSVESKLDPTQAIMTGNTTINDGVFEINNNNDSIFQVTSQQTTIGGILDVQGNGNSFIGGDLEVQGTGTSTINGTLSVSRGLGVGEGLDVVGEAVLRSRLDVRGTGNSFIRGNLMIQGSGTSEIDHNLEVKGNLEVDNELKLTGLNGVLIGNGVNAVTAVGIGTDNQVLTVVNGEAAWASASEGGVTSLDLLTNVKMGGTDFTNSLLIQPNRTGTDAPETGTLANANNNIGIGAEVFKFLTEGQSNTCVGSASGENLTEGNNNTCMGFSSGAALTRGSRNTCVGTGSGFALTTGGDNTCVGTFSGFALTTGPNNTCMGVNSGRNLTTGGNNTCMGVNSGRNLTTGVNNTCVGTASGDTLTEGNNNIIIGFQAVPSAAGVSNEIVLGNLDNDTLRCAENTIAALSDGRDKTNVVDSEYGLDFVNKIRPVQFTWKRRVLEPSDENHSKNGITRLGFIAQELKSAMPNNTNDILDLVYEANPERIEAKYGNLIPILTKAIQELSTKNEALVARVEELEKRLN